MIKSQSQKVARSYSPLATGAVPLHELVVILFLFTHWLFDECTSAKPLHNSMQDVMIYCSYNINGINPHYKAKFGEGVFVIADVRCDRVKRYSWKYTTGYVTNTRNKQRNIQCDFIKVFMLGFFYCFKWFSDHKTFVVSQNLQNFTVVHSRILSIIYEFRYNRNLLHPGSL
jgi:hypothetical protein